MTAATANIRKAALLVRSLDGDSAALLLAQLSPQEARAVRQAVRELRDVDPHEQEEMARELRKADAPTRAITGDSGVEVSFLNAVVELPRPTSSPQHKVSVAVETKSPFAWLEHGDLPTLAAVLEREHLSTVAVVLSHLPPQRGADLLAALPPGRRAAVLERLADLGESDRASLEVIEKSLADWIARQKRERQMRADRLQAIRAMLEHTGSETRDRVMTDLARTDNRLASELNLPPNPVAKAARDTPEVAPRWAGQVTHLRVPRVATDRQVQESASSPVAARPADEVLKRIPLRRFDFWQLQQLDRHSLGTLLGHCDAESVVLALAGGSEELMQYVLQQLAPESARQLQRRVNHLSHVRLSDVAKAQQSIALTGSELIASGKIEHRSQD
jgi:flagellar motor switch protein FliG